MDTEVGLYAEVRLAVKVNALSEQAATWQFGIRGMAAFSI